MPNRKHSHYFKPCPFSHVDAYRVIGLCGITDACIQHAMKKLMVTGGRGNKDIGQDIQEAIDTLERWKEMRKEERADIQVGDTVIFSGVHRVKDGPYVIKKMHPSAKKKNVPHA